MEPNGPRLETIVLKVVLAEALHEELLGAVPLLGFGRVSVFFLQIDNVWALLKVLRINAGRGGEQKALGRVEPGRLEHVQVDHGAITGDLGVKSGDVPDPAHVGRQVVDLVYPARSNQAVIETAQVHEFELVARAWLVFGVLKVDSSYPIT